MTRAPSTRRDQRERKAREHRRGLPAAPPRRSLRGGRAGPGRRLLGRRRGGRGRPGEAADRGPGETAASSGSGSSGRAPLALATGVGEWRRAAGQDAQQSAPHSTAGRGTAQDPATGAQRSPPPPSRVVRRSVGPGRASGLMSRWTTCGWAAPTAPRTRRRGTVRAALAEAADELLEDVAARQQLEDEEGGEGSGRRSWTTDATRRRAPFVLVALLPRAPSSTAGRRRGTAEEAPHHSQHIALLEAPAPPRACAPSASRCAARPGSSRVPPRARVAAVCGEPAAGRRPRPAPGRARTAGRPRRRDERRAPARRVERPHAPHRWSSNLVGRAPDAYPRLAERGRGWGEHEPPRPPRGAATPEAPRPKAACPRTPTAGGGSSSALGWTRHTPDQQRVPSAPQHLPRRMSQWCASVIYPPYPTPIGTRGEGSHVLRLPFAIHAKYAPHAALARGRNSDETGISRYHPGTGVGAQHAAATSWLRPRTLFTPHVHTWQHPPVGPGGRFVATTHPRPCGSTFHLGAHGRPRRRRLDTAGVSAPVVASSTCLDPGFARIRFTPHMPQARTRRSPRLLGQAIDAAVSRSVPPPFGQKAEAGRAAGGPLSGFVNEQLC